MATLCITALPPRDAARRNRLLELAGTLSGVELVLYGDGVYNLVSGSQAAADLAGAPLKIYVLAEDVENRGLKERIIPEAEQVDYAKVAELIVAAERTVTGV